MSFVDVGADREQQGFTLLELIVAIAVFAMMSAMVYTGLSSALNTRAQAEAQADRLAGLQKAFMIMGRDIEQMVLRPVRDNYASELGAINGGGYGSAVLEFSRSGFVNPMGLPRSNLQRVAYVLVEGKLIRQSWFVMDRSLDTESLEGALLTDVKAVELRFMDAEKQWQQQWPSLNANPEDDPVLPRAVEITVELEDWGRITRVFEVVG